MCLSRCEESVRRVLPIQTEEATGNPRQGDAAFADYLINVGVSFRIPSKKVKVDPELMNEFSN